MGIIRECGGKMNMHDQLWTEAATDFFEVLQQPPACASDVQQTMCTAQPAIRMTLQQQCMHVLTSTDVLLEHGCLHARLCTLMHMYVCDVHMRVGAACSHQVTVPTSTPAD
jgi:hypothetical protein